MSTSRRAEASFATQQRLLNTARSGLTRESRFGPFFPEHHRNLGLLIATGQAAGGFIRLVLGKFGMDLYEVYWRFSAVLAIILSGMEPRTRLITGSLLEAVSPGRTR
jgi:hypothetical protein